MKWAYYNEHEPFAAAWLRELIKAGHIADGEVDERDIQQVEPGDLRGFVQCHFFAGIGVWSYALRAAGWSDDTPVWTGSCPCQSFSASGKRGGFSDHRHLWPSWFRLIRECRPNVCFGEQVASKDGLAWFDVVSADMEGEGYAIGAADTCAAGYGAPMLSQRLYFVAQAQSERRAEAWRQHRGRSTERLGNSGKSSGMESSTGHGLPRWPGCSSVKQERESPRSQEQRSGIAGGMVAADMPTGTRIGEHGGKVVRIAEPEGLNVSGFTNGFWRDAEWIYCRDEKFRPIEPGTFPLAYGTASRVGRLRGYGNALNAEQAKGFIEAYLSAEAQLTEKL